MDIIFFKLILIFSGVALSAYLFYKAAGTLMPNKLNLISYTFYLIILQAYIGVSLAYLGDRKHYMIGYIIEDKNIDKTFYLLLFTIIAMPLTILLIEKIFKVDAKRDYDIYLKKEVETSNEKNVFLITAALSAFCIMVMTYMFLRIGYIPIFKLIFKDPNLDLALERIRISNITSYVANIFVLTFIPMLSYLAFTFCMTVKDKKWKILFSILFISSLLIKTYNFAKAPVVFYLFVFIIIYIYVKGGIKLKFFAPLIVFLGAIIFAMYALNGRLNNIFSIYEGPLGRTIYTQAVTLMFHIDLFTSGVPLLMGRSFSPSILHFLGVGKSHVRSGKVVMGYYGSRNVYKGIAGVMNAMFVGEAFANFGVKGVVFAAIYMGILFGGIFVIFLKCKKDPINITLFAVLTSNFAIASQGGFCDFIYSSSTISIVGLLLFIKYSSVIFNKFNIKIN
ncbi:O-antigen polymerase [Clostridium senegalense]|uniref:Oligosaccharide repeat unit polymerase n=1 Tax=Clostridium senegalense TaxID=1465809 RepID=A0A6M0H1F2_9CLOT|nr:O-antigen polymerase [Clostridium senegalense]NEU03923.1 oligosaccharide repeat unit polymerase [Clostridium senegalense]